MERFVECIEQLAMVFAHVQQTSGKTRPTVTACIEFIYFKPEAYLGDKLRKQ
jgi:hypothetical protein